MTANKGKKKTRRQSEILVSERRRSTRNTRLGKRVKDEDSEDEIVLSSKKKCAASVKNRAYVEIPVKSPTGNTVRYHYVVAQKFDLLI